MRGAVDYSKIVIYKIQHHLNPDILYIGYTTNYAERSYAHKTNSKRVMKYNIEFDTLVLDCEGAFYYILMDMPEILDTITLIIVENDYDELYKKDYVDTVLKNNNFYVDYFRAGGGRVCSDNFFEVWKRDSTKI
jgi:hypothetical protein